MDQKVPTARDDDPEDVRWALSTAGALAECGEHAKALTWLRRAVESATEAAADTRSLELAKAAAELAELLDTKSIPPGPPGRDAITSIAVTIDDTGTEDGTENADEAAPQPAGEGGTAPDTVVDAAATAKMDTGLKTKDIAKLRRELDAPAPPALAAVQVVVTGSPGERTLTLAATVGDGPRPKGSANAILVPTSVADSIALEKLIGA